MKPEEFISVLKGLKKFETALFKNEKGKSFTVFCGVGSYICQMDPISFPFYEFPCPPYGEDEGDSLWFSQRGLYSGSVSKCALKDFKHVKTY